MIKIKNDKVNGFIAKVNVVDIDTGEIVNENVIIKCEHHSTIAALNLDMAKFGLPTRMEFVEWVD